MAHDDAQTVQVSDARTHALAFARIASQTDERLQSFADIAPDPLEIFDIDGDLLFYDFRLMGTTGVVGYVRAAADERVGAPVVSVEVGPRSWDAAASSSAATARVESAGEEVIRTRVVCYSYPKIGVLVYSRTPDGHDRTRIYDVASGVEVPTSPPRGPSDHVSARSLLRDRSTSVHTDAFAEGRQALLRVSQPSPPSSPLMRTTTQQVWLDVPCQTTIGVPVYAQITPYNCVPASAQMVLDHYGWNFPQSSIATAMGTTAAAGGTSYNPGFTGGIATLTKSTLTPGEPDIGAAESAQWSLATGELDANRPVFTQMPGHYRVCVGYSVTELLVDVRPGLPPPVVQTLHIHDPEPFNSNVCQGGSDYWENWAGTAIQWFVTLQH